MIELAAALLLLKAFLTAAENALRLADLGTLQALAARGHRGAERAVYFASRPERLWATTRSLARLALVTATVLIAASFDRPVWALLIVLPVVFLTAELLPQALVAGRLERMAPGLATPLMVLFHVFRPLVAVVELTSSLLARTDDDERPAASREDLQRLVDQDTGDSDMALGERAMIARIFEFSHLTASDSMIPLKEVCALSADASVKDAVTLIAREGYSRLPVYRDRMEEVVGILHHIDLLRARDATQSVGELMRPPLFVPETQEIDDILVILQRRAASAAVVVDEFGKTVGLLTLEDILEEIVGEIDDEHDPGEKPWRMAPGGGYLLSARMLLEQVERTFDLTLEVDDDVETVAGLLLERLKHIPEVGETLDLPDGVRLTVTKASPRAIEEILLTGPVRAREG